MIVIRVPAMSSRQVVRSISARVGDVPGVETIKADPLTRTVQVTGPADPDAVASAIGTVSYAVDPGVDGLALSATSLSGGPTVDTFAFADTTFLSEADRSQAIELAHGDELDLRHGPGTKQLGGRAARQGPCVQEPLDSGASSEYQRPADGDDREPSSAAGIGAPMSPSPKEQAMDYPGQGSTDRD